MAKRYWTLDKKTRYQIMYHHYESDNRKLIIEYMSLNKNWMVHDNKYIKDYYFKTKSKALKFAKSYMRKH